jgi:Tfp pilus assembly protein PilW
MECKITSTKPRRGFTLAEFLISSGIGAIFFVVIGSLIFFSARSFVAMANYVDLENSSRNALDMLSRDIRQSDSLSSYVTNQLVLNYTNGTQITYVFNLSTNGGTLNRTLAGQTTTLLRECDSGRFSVFQRNPVNGAYDQYPVGTPGTTKLVQVDWRCSRQIMKAKVNTESVQSAKIVIRRQ